MARFGQRLFRHVVRARARSAFERVPRAVRMPIELARRRWLWERATRSLPPLRHVQIQTHSRCNADCVFCPYVTSWHHDHPGSMTDALFARVLDELRPWARNLNRGTIAPYLMQEPLIDPKIYDRIEAIYAAFPGTSVEISTNAEPMNERSARRLVELLAGRRHALWLSHHGTDADTLAKVMRTDHARSVRNIVGLVAHARGRLDIRIVGAGESLDGSTRYFDPATYRAYWERTFREHGVEPLGVEIDTIRFHDRAGQLGGPGRPHEKVREIGARDPFHCFRVDEWLHVLYDGRIRLCCMDYHGEVALPSLADMSLVEYFRSDAYKDLVASVLGLRETPDDFLCKRCRTPGG